LSLVTVPWLSVKTPCATISLAGSELLVRVIWPPATETWPVEN
jgi:hypothetical protein